MNKLFGGNATSVGLQEAYAFNIFTKTNLGIFKFFIFLLISGLPIWASSSDKNPANLPIEQRVQSIVERAYDFVSTHSDDMTVVQKAFSERPEFRDDAYQLYIFMHTYNAPKKKVVCVAQGVRPSLIGKNMWGLRTPNGRLLFLEVIATFEQHDAFWIDYDWLNPYTKKIGKKRSYYKKIILKNGQTAWIGCGFWKN